MFEVKGSFIGGIEMDMDVDVEVAVDTVGDSTEQSLYSWLRTLEVYPHDRRHLHLNTTPPRLSQNTEVPSFHILYQISSLPAWTNTPYSMHSRRLFQSFQTSLIEEYTLNHNLDSYMI